MTPDLYAYTVCNRQPGWAWSVYDVDGRLVAAGLERSQHAAVRAVDRIIGVPEANAQPALQHAS